MDYGDVQGLAEIYALQALAAENVQPSLLIVSQAGAIVYTASDPLALPAPARDSPRARTLELRGLVMIDEQIGRQLLAEYDEYLGSTPH